MWKQQVQQAVGCRRYMSMQTTLQAVKQQAPCKMSSPPLANPQTPVQQTWLSWRRSRRQRPWQQGCRLWCPESHPNP